MKEKQFYLSPFLGSKFVKSTLVSSATYSFASLKSVLEKGKKKEQRRRRKESFFFNKKKVLHRDKLTKNYLL